MFRGKRMKMLRWVRFLVMLLAIALGLMLGYQQILPAARLPEGFVEAPSSLQDAQQGPDLNLMLSHIRVLTREARPVDSDALRAAQAYLKDQLTQMGYAYQTESYQLSIGDILALESERVGAGRRPFGLTEQGIRDYAGIGDKPTMDLSNIVVHVDAPDTDETILFVAHTDSVKMGPGAFDDGVSVAAMLEALRQLKEVSPVRDLVFLFTDGEEQVLLGAAKFVQAHPELRDITRLVINLEARGNRGALLLFETTENNLNLLRTYREAAGRPASLSLATAIYRSMQSDTDLTRFMMAGYPGLNLAVIQGAEVYHTPQDNYEGFDRRSAAQYLDTVTTMAHYFAIEKNLQLEADQDGVFFPLLQGRLVVMPGSAARWIAWAAALLYLLALAFALGKRRARLGRVLLSAGLQLLSVAAAFGVGLVVVKAARALFGNPVGQYALGFTAGVPIFIATLAVLALISALAYHWMIGRQGEGESALLGVLLLPAALSALTPLLFPSASYLFSLCLLAGLLVWATGRWCLLGLVPAAAAFLILLLFVPLVALVYIALSFTSAQLAAAIAMLPLTMLLPFSLPPRARKRGA